ncbi:hypothetical protein J2W30_003717 [Variovorax boronicumulans]|uniref:DUF2514 family protein n=1 Tax=Variovorax boronicumulans TaxID=436515 RepID=UPI00278273A4|nr:DUF2514 family protein [Variovorax boronicumulans]MDQ0035944.1 hypothetical protein [Variovorax boronicumulans]
MALLLNPKVWAALVVALVLGLAGAFLYRAGKAVVRNDFDAYKIAQQEARILADRARTQRAEARQTTVDKEARDGQQQIASLEAERDAARADGDSLRSAIRTATSRAGSPPRAASTGPGEPGPDALGMFADLLERADSRAEAVASFADRLRIAGTVCERSYDALTAP